MGNLNCTRCCQGSELKQEFDLKSSVYFKQIAILSINRDTQCTESTQYRNKPVIMIQSFWRKILTEKEYKKLRSTSFNNPYFPMDEAKETISKGKLGQKSKRDYQYFSGCLYQGDWLGGFRHGNGECKWPDGCCFKGEWQYGYPCGSGTFTYKDGEVFSGNWINPFANLKNRSFLEDIVQGKRDGFGNFYLVWLSCKSFLSKPKRLNHKKCIKKIKLALGDIEDKVKEADLEIVGFFQSEKMPEDFREENIEGIVYSGQWKEEKRAGVGKNVWENGDEYIGNWEEDMQNGWGKNYWVDGSRYVGQYVNNLKEGIGEYFWEDSTKYIGEWKNNIIHGIGRYIWADGREYAGQWQNGLMDGFGIYKFTDGRRFEGNWKLGKKHGIGITITADGSIQKNVWNEGKIQR